MRDQAKRLAERALREIPSSEVRRIERLYLLIYGRPPERRESELGLAMIKEKSGDAASWADYAHLLLCANEFLYVD